MPRPTLKDLTEKTGFSRSTVATILRGEEGRFAQETVARVKKAAQESGWKPNQQSRNLQKQRFGALLYVFATVGRHSNASPALLVGLGEAAERQGYHLVIQPMDAELPRETPAFLNVRFYDGMIVNMNRFHAEAADAMEKWLNRFEVPVVWLNHDRPWNALYPDEEGGARFIGKKLINAHARRVLYVGPGATGHFSAVHRPKRLQELLSAAGIAMERVGVDAPEPGSYFGPESAAALRRLDLASFDHLVFYGPYLIARFLAHTAGRFSAPPRILSFDCTESQDPPGMWPGVSIPWDELARRAVDMAVGRVEDGGKRAPSIVVDGVPIGV
ncbi:MAG: LacI family DNA-binding transcriptional regulator [Spirochaetes bacterium]|nr:LacI family DNA-binding transcriptional regulator [Spirochaetota bacterium]